MRARAQRSRHERRGHVLAGLALAALLGGRPVVAPAEETEAVRVPESWFATAVVRGDTGMQVVDYWSRGPNMRARTLMRGHPITTIVFGGRYIVYDELTGKGIDIGRALARSPPTRIGRGPSRSSSTRSGLLEASGSKSSSSARARARSGR